MMGFQFVGYALWWKLALIEGWCRFEDQTYEQLWAHQGSGLGLQLENLYLWGLCPFIARGPGLVFYWNRPGDLHLWFGLACLSFLLQQDLREKTARAGILPAGRVVEDDPRQREHHPR